MINNKEISFENMKRMAARRLEVDDTLLHAAEKLKMYGSSDQIMDEVMSRLRSQLNKQVYELAEQQHVSIYDICLRFMPQMSEPKFSDTCNEFHYEQEIRLVPMPFEPDKGPGYWKDKYFRLKKRMRQLIDAKED